MGYKLTIDKGNSSTKMALWDDNAIVRSARCDHDKAASTLADLKASEEIDRAIISSVCPSRSAAHTDIQRLLDHWKVPTILLDHSTPLPIKINYSEQLGNDRVAAAVGAADLAKGRPALAIDIGTAVTYDFITPDRGFTGGNIAPGIELRLQALSNAALLPKADINGPAPLLAHNTNDAIRAGAIRGIIAEIFYYLDQLGSRFNNIATFLTGGDAFRIEAILNEEADVKKYTPFIVEPHLVMRGLKIILDYNENS